MQEKRHDRVVEMRLCFFSGKVGDYKMLFVATRKCRSTLYLARKIIEGHHGTISLDGKKMKKEKGSVFVVQIPYR